MQDFSLFFPCVNSDLCIKRSLGILLIIFALMIVFRIERKQTECSQNHSGFHPIQFWHSLQVAEKNSLVVTSIGYLFLLVSGLTPAGMLQSFDILQKPAEWFLRIEPYIAFVALLFVTASRLIWGSRMEYLNTVNTAIRILTVVSVICTLLTQQIMPYWYNILWYLVVGIILMILKLLSLERLTVTDGVVNHFDPISSYNELFPPRARLADQLFQIIRSQNAGGISICVTGPWGSGKTSLVEGVCDKLRKETDTKGYEFIVLRALELDSLSSLFSYLFERIRSILKARGAYVGPGSEYRQLIASAGGLITHAQFSTILEQRLFPRDEDYRGQRERLEALMESVLQNDKIIIILDDIERCEAEKAMEFLYFVKEIATMRCCVSFFLTDDACLPVPSHINGVKTTFFDKFFNYRFTIMPLLPEEMMAYYEGKLNLTQTLGEFRLKLPKTAYVELQQRLQKRVESIQVSTHEQDREKAEQHAAQQRSHLYACIERLEQSLSRPRTMLKIYKSYDRFCGILRDQFASISMEELQTYLQSIQISDLLFLLSYAEVCFPTEWEEIQKREFKSYLDELHASDNETKRFLAALVQDVLYQDYFIFNSYTYQQMKQILFVDTLLDCPEELHNIVNGFTSQEQELFAAIEKDDQQAMAVNWLAMLKVVVARYASQEKSQFYLERLFQFAAAQVESGNWSADEIFQIFDHSKIDERYFVQNGCVVPFASLAAQLIPWKNMVGQVSDANLRLLQIAMSNYLYVYCIPIGRFIQYVGPQEKSIVLSAMEQMKLSKKNPFEDIADFVSQLRSCEIWQAEWTDPLDELNGILGCTKKILEERGYGDYPDMQAACRQAYDAMKELRAVVHFMEHVQSEHSHSSTDDLLQTVNGETLPRIISFFEEKLQQQDGSEGQLQKELRDFFQRLELCQPQELSQKDRKRLHNLVTQYYMRKTDDQDTVFYLRNVLLALDARAQQSQLFNNSAVH